MKSKSLVFFSKCSLVFILQFRLLQIIFWLNIELDTSLERQHINATFFFHFFIYESLIGFYFWILIEKSYEKDLQRVPDCMDFEAIKEMVDFLEKFKTETENVSAPTKPLVHRLIREILDVNLHLKKWSTKVNFVHLIPDMKDKYDKY